MHIGSKDINREKIYLEARHSALGPLQSHLINTSSDWGEASSDP